MKPIRVLAAALALAFVLAGCGGSTDTSTSTSAPPTTAAAAASPSSSSSASSSASSTSTTAAGAADATAFCSMLADGADKAGALMAAVGKPDLAAKLAEVKASNDAILAASPSEIRDAIKTVYAIADQGRKALDPALGAEAKRAAAAEAAAAMAKPETKAAIASYKTWVQGHCATLATKILSGV